MAKLSPEILEEGRELIRAYDLEGFLGWVRTHSPLMNQDLIRSTYEKVFRAQDSEKGLKLFDAVFPNLDPGAERTGIFVRIGCLLFIGLGLLGGIVYLVRSVFGQ